MHARGFSSVRWEFCSRPAGLSVAWHLYKFFGKNILCAQQVIYVCVYVYGQQQQQLWANMLFFPPPAYQPCWSYDICVVGLLTLTDN